MEDLDQKISSIEHKLKRVLQTLVDKNKDLLEKNQNLHIERVQLLDKIENYEAKLVIIEKSEDSEKEELDEVKGKLKDYISEIDSCIELLQIDG